MRTYMFAALLLTVALAACGSPDRKVVVVQPTQAPAVVAAPPAPQPVVVMPPASDVTVSHAVVSSYGGTVRQRPDPQSPIVTTLVPGAEVSVIGSANGGSWSHVVANGVDGYVPRVELQ